MAKKQWRCFHCDEVFTSPRCAAEHFGDNMDSHPACRIAAYEGHLVAYIRKLEAKLADYRSDSDDIMRAIMTQEADHRRALNRAEEDGYNKGVQDMLADAERAIRRAPSLDENGYIAEKAAVLTTLANGVR